MFVKFLMKFICIMILYQYISFPSLLEKCVRDPIFILPLKWLKIKENLSYEEVLIEIMDQEVKK